MKEIFIVFFFFSFPKLANYYLSNKYSLFAYTKDMTLIVTSGNDFIQL